MLVKEAMTRKVIKIDSEKTVFDASQIYKEYKVGCLIVTKDEKCIGIITERDIIERTICNKKDPETTKVKEIMSTEIKTIHELDTLEKAINLIKEYKIKKLPVIVNGEIAGILTVTDISRVRPELSDRFVDSWIKPRWVD